MPASLLTKLNALCFGGSIGLRVASVVLRAHGHAASALTAYRAFQALLSAGSVLVTLGLLHFLAHWRRLGVLNLIFSSMLANTGPWLCLWLTFVFGFCVAFLGLDAGGFHRSAASFFRAKQQLGGGAPGGGAAPAGGGAGAAGDGFKALWTAFWPWGADGLEVAPIEQRALWPSFMVPFWSTFAIILPDDFDLVSSIFLFGFMCISNIVLLNLLIACYADEYSRIEAQADVEFALLRYRDIFSYSRVKTTVPPPFNLPYVVHVILQHTWRRLRYGKKAAHAQRHEADRAESRDVINAYPSAASGGAHAEARGGGGGGVAGVERVGTFYTELDLAVDKFVQQSEAQQHSSAEAMLSQLLEKQEQAGEEHRLKLMQIEEMLGELKQLQRELTRHAPGLAID